MVYRLPARSFMQVSSSSLDQIVPHSCGGADTRGNLVWSAEKVTQRKAGRTRTRPV
jgi:hypothetical protein